MLRGSSAPTGADEHGVTRAGVLKVGAASLVGAVFGGSLFSGRAAAGNLYPAPCRPGQGYTCGGTNFNVCGGPGSGCACATQFANSKLQNTKSYCVDFNVCCSDMQTCPGGQSQCPPGYTCTATTCCGEPVCLPPCGTTGIAPGVCCLTPAGQANDCQTCSSGGNCNTGFNSCSSCGGPQGLGYYCYTTTENTAVCAGNSYCDEVPTCSSSADCGPGYACITSNGCTGCNNVGGVCVPLCTTSGAAPKKAKRHGMTAAGMR